MQASEILRAMSAYLMLDYVMSDESIRIQKPELDKGKYEDYCSMLVTVAELVREIGGSIEATDPDFPTFCHQVKLVLNTAEDDIDITAVKGKLSSALETADEVSIDTDTKGNIRVYFGCLDVYTGASH